MKISKRLKAIAHYVEDNSNVIDVGCDHALLDIYLVKNKKNIQIIASDIKENPLQKAKENIEKYHVEDKIKLSLADGLEKLDTKTDTILISGMGYFTIRNILKKGNLTNIKTLIISINENFNLLKKLIKKIGFSIQYEQIIEDHNKFYIIIKAVKGRKRYSNQKIYNEEYQKYLKYVLNKKESIIKKIPKRKRLLRLKLRKEIKKINSQLK